MGDEAERLTEQGWEELAEQEYRAWKEELSAQFRGEAEELYQDATAASVGSSIVCPSCRERFVKATYHNKFCSNQQTGGKKNCKDWYWNNVDDYRRERARNR